MGKDSKAILFVISLDYTNGTKGFEEALALAVDLSISENGLHLPFIMVFNKSDIFTSLIGDTPLTAVPNIKWTAGYTPEKEEKYLSRIEAWFKESIVDAKIKAAIKEMPNASKKDYQEGIRSNVTAHRTCALDKQITTTVM